MRIFEWLLLASNIGYLAFLLTAKHNRRLHLLIAGGVSALLLVLHVTLEGYRIHLIVPYLFTIIAVTMATMDYMTGKERRRLSKMLTIPFYTIVSLLLLKTGLLLYAFPVVKMPEPTGQYAIGTEQFHWIDEAREETFDDQPEGNRELIVQLWYPAERTSGQPELFFPDMARMSESEQIAEMLGGLKGPVEAFGDYLKYIPSHSYAGAEIAGDQEAYPVIVLNHGFGTTRQFHVSQAEELASQGYIVASIDHTYSTFATFFPDGRVTTNTTSKLGFEIETLDAIGKVWTEDVAFVLDQLEKLQSGEIAGEAAGKLALDRIGVFGHSFGGATAYDSAFDARIKASINMDGPLFRKRGEAALGKPFMFMLSDEVYQNQKKLVEQNTFTDEELDKLGATREEFESHQAEFEQDLAHLKQLAQNGASILYVEDTKHYNFSDAQFISPVLKYIGLNGNIDPKRSDRIVKAYILDFFNKHLKGDGGELAAGADSSYPEVKFVPEMYAEWEPASRK
ncbi:dienelactone hydrolase [Paenibacillus sp. J5C_2022]|uniref:alpha/beta hydrolase family protein n=1 Tax=Paenibacillus sp. J5C2022 TaxID=2977129 RepID=UPI0021D39C94|nr:dienelactone hydrolase [Paenibacillus sp. J5C2022]MCU6712092.1 dienelactone hydrolase [Paenibacillus sp. J5C2022]